MNLARVAQYMASSQGEDFPRGELMDTLMKEFTAPPAGRTAARQEAATR